MKQSKESKPGEAILCHNLGAGRGEGDPGGPWGRAGAGEGGSQEFLKQSPDGIPKAEMTCFWNNGCPASLVMMEELTTSNSLGEKGTDFGVRQI